MRKIPLTQNKFALVDDEDFIRINKIKWHYAEYAKGRGYAKANNKGKKPTLLRMHRFILGLNGKEKVDHINRNPLDNRRKNLRIVTQSQNMMNSGLRTNNKSGYKGVCFVKREKKWLATTWKDGKQIYIGIFDNPREAAKSYNEKVVELHGLYAVLNKI